MTYHHLCLDIRGALKNWTAKDLRSAFGVPADKARDLLMDELAKGRKFIPMGKCDNFDYQEGCLGHPAETPASAPCSREAKGQGKETVGCVPLESPKDKADDRSQPR